MAIDWTHPNKWTQQTVDEFVRQYSDELVRYAFCIVADTNAAEEIALQAMATFVYRNSGTALSKAYLYRIVRNHAINYMRRHRRLVSLQDVEEVLSAGNVVETSTLQDEQYQMLYRCLNRLPKDYRAALYLHYIQGFAQAEIGKVMRKNTKQMYNLLSRAKVALKNKLLEEGFEYENL